MYLEICELKRFSQKLSISSFSYFKFFFKWGVGGEALLLKEF